jgi:hypothetical protein
MFNHRSINFEQANWQENWVFSHIDALKGYINKPMVKRIRCSLIGTIILNIQTTKRIGLFDIVNSSFELVLLCWVAGLLAGCLCIAQQVGCSKPASGKALPN